MNPRQTRLIFCSDLERLTGAQAVLGESSSETQLVPDPAKLEL